MTVLTRPAPEEPKEVAPVISIKQQTTPMTPQWINERFAMPNCGQAFGSATPRSGVFGTSAFAAIVRERQIVPTTVVTKGHLGLAIGDVAYVPGTNAWSPPLC
jgi:hypothetical protein